jgi:hypothetical protein
MGGSMALPFAECGLLISLNDPSSEPMDKIIQTAKDGRESDFRFPISVWLLRSRIIEVVRNVSTMIALRRPKYLEVID